ncbi:hypothetical protein U1Q18_009301 [Sarracenia purpurea var. burkii]
MQAFGVSPGAPLRLLVPLHLHHRRRHLDRRVGVDVRVPVLPVRDDNSGASSGLDQGSYSCHEVVHRPDPLLARLSYLLIPLICS